MKEVFVDNDELLIIVIEMKILYREDRHKNGSIKDIKKTTQKKSWKKEDALLKFRSDIDLRNLKTDFLVKKRILLTKKTSIPTWIF